MNYSFDSLQFVLELLKQHWTLWITQMSQISGKSRVILHKYVKELRDLWKIEKIWVFPKIKYRIVGEEKKEWKNKMTEKEIETISKLKSLNKYKETIAYARVLKEYIDMLKSLKIDLMHQNKNDSF